jgi:hypothetical protein
MLSSRRQRLMRARSLCTCRGARPPGKTGGPLRVEECISQRRRSNWSHHQALRRTDPAGPGHRLLRPLKTAGPARHVFRKTARPTSPGYCPLQHGCCLCFCRSNKFSCSAASPVSLAVPAVVDCGESCGFEMRSVLVAGFVCGFGMYPRQQSMELGEFIGGESSKGFPLDVGHRNFNRRHRAFAVRSDFDDMTTAVRGIAASFRQPFAFKVVQDRYQSARID